MSRKRIVTFLAPALLLAFAALATAAPFAMALGKRTHRNSVDLARFHGATGRLELMIDGVLVSSDHFQCALHYDDEKSREVITFVNDYGVTETARFFTLGERTRRIRRRDSLKLVNRSEAELDRASPCGMTIFYPNVKPRFIKNKLTATGNTVEIRTRYWCGPPAEPDLQGRHVDRAICRFEEGTLK